MVSNELRAILKAKIIRLRTTGLPDLPSTHGTGPRMKISSHDKLLAKGLPSREWASRKGKADFRDSGRPRGLSRSEGGGVLTGWAAMR